MEHRTICIQGGTISIIDGEHVSPSICGCAFNEAAKSGGGAGDEGRGVEVHAGYWFVGSHQVASMGQHMVKIGQEK